MTTPAVHYPPVPTNVTKPLVHRFAEQCAARLGFGPGVAMEPLVNKLGGKLEYRLTSGQPGRLPESIVVESETKFTIYVPSTTSIERDRFTIAHELGHFFLHYPMVSRLHPGGVMAATRWVDKNDPVQARAEWEANWFAAAFLMPTALFREYRRSHNDLADVASYFGVSLQAATVRASTIA